MSLWLKETAVGHETVLGAETEEHAEIAERNRKRDY
jgi:hypothetical protein